MNINQLNNSHLTEEQCTAINEAVKALEKAMEPLRINLTADDRHRYGRVNEQNKLFINKVNDYTLSQPNLKSTNVDWEEFAKDFKSRSFLDSLSQRLERLLTRTTNAKILHDFDNYQDSLEDYSYTSYQAGSRHVGYEDKHRDLKQFFTKSRKATTSKDNKADKK